MGNVCSGRNGGPNDAENDMALQFANAASVGARQAVMDAAQKVQHRGAQSSGIVLPADTLIAGVLPAAIAQGAAAEGAKLAIEDKARHLGVLSRLAIPLKAVMFAASSGAQEGLKAAEVLHMNEDVERNAGLQSMTLEVAAAAAGAGAWVACLVAAQAHITLAPEPNTTKYTALLGSLLGASMPASAAMYGLLHESSDAVKLYAFGGITLGAVVVSSGLIVGLLGTTGATARYTKIVAIGAIFLLLIFFTVVLCMIFDSHEYKVPCAITFPVLIGIVLVVALRFLYCSW